MDALAQKYFDRGAQSELLVSVISSTLIFIYEYNSPVEGRVDSPSSRALRNYKNFGAVHR